MKKKELPPEIGGRAKKFLIQFEHAIVKNDLAFTQQLLKSRPEEIEKLEIVQLKYKVQVKGFLLTRELNELISD